MDIGLKCRICLIQRRYAIKRYISSFEVLIDQMKTLKPSEIAKYCNVHSRTVSRWIAKGLLKGHKLPGRGNYRVVLSDFLNFLHNQKMPIHEHLIAGPSDEGLISNKKKRILIIDDEAGVRNAVRRVLKKTGHDIIIAEDGFQAGIKILSEHPHLIILDLSMPGIDGYGVISFVRNSSELRHLKIIVLSGLTTSELAAAVKIGADDALSKPYENNELLNHVNRLLE